MEYKYRFSIIMAVYNQEAFINAAINSVLTQTEESESIQLILINDGSTDRSGEIAYQFSEKYDNVFYLSQENKGVSAARNLGMSIAEGEFWNFMDPDDMIDDTMLEKVYSFLKPRKKLTDVAVVPLYFFGDQTGDHPLNTRFSSGTRLVDLTSAGQDMIALSLSTAFVSKEAFKNRKFNTTLKVSEDMLLLNTILLDKLTLGIVSDVEYWYRRINGYGALKKTASELTFEETKLRFSVDATLLENSLARYQAIPKFIQNTVIYDLSWQLKGSAFQNDAVLKEEQKLIIRDQYLYPLFSKYIDYALIQQSLRLPYWVKKEIIERKADYLGNAAVQNAFSVTRNSYKTVDFEDRKATFVVAEENKENISLYFQIRFGSQYLKYQPDFKISLHIGRAVLKPTYIQSDSGNISKNLYQDLVVQEYLRFDLDKNNDQLLNTAIKVVISDGIKKKAIIVQYKKHEFSSLDDNKITIDAISENFATQLENSQLQIVRRDAKVNNSLLQEVFGNDRGEKFQYRNRLLSKAKPIWLFEDRPSKAGDNAEAMFSYVVRNHPEIDAYFVISEESEDYERIAQLGNVLPKFSKEHQDIWAICDVILSAHAEYQIFNPMGHGNQQKHEDYYKGLRILNKPKFVFLQHGISRSSHSLSPWLQKSNKNISLLVTSTLYEEQEFLKETYHYNKSIVKSLGMPRLDELLINSDVNKEKLILFMPTWRKYLEKLSDEQFMRTDYFIQINNFLNDKVMQNHLKNKKYVIAVKLHPNLTKFSELFKKNDYYYFSDESYKLLFKKGAIGITDFSSAILDFAYMKKPIIQYMFDEKNYFNGHIFQRIEGQKEEAIYGNIYTNEQYKQFVNEVIQKIDDPVMSPEFQKKVDKDFPYRDGNNTKRVFDAVSSMMK
ncbi:CDP-glycerol glycerophosphotransferase family protein [Leuconostoc carnosum]|uniref:CDP-glycerol glycerophosphotransferase family protein n=1 Tax=Leuconostoc carnosum TaxID=1252 RepID=UPI00123A3FAD|nr:CDP-glycerol glycerophosphotransferase family protein [Leuconostoc carnosum]KAA8375840.1 glycosyltransferase [Leuconostoc carnosum]KAA8378504.1 glycosyltransferase [Leuconostoc carnosum]